MALFTSKLRLNSPFIMVIFGVSGDLTRRKLVPALFDLYNGSFLPDKFTILGFARREWTREDMIREAGSEIQKRSNIDQNKLNQFFTHFDYLQGNFDEPTDYPKLALKIEKLDSAIGKSGRRLFYLATPAENYPDILEGIKQAKLEQPSKVENGWTRVVIEKPFGRDLASSKLLNLSLRKIFHENQIYRIDHYLAKETAQNIMTFRFANALFEPVWKSNYIERIEIDMFESIGVGTRGNFYERTGAMRDVVQNHLMQLMALVTMDQPNASTADAFRDSRTRLLEAVRCFDVNHLGRNVVLGQYASYRREEHVAPASTTETFASVRVEIDTQRWSGVPIFLTTGKMMGRTLTQIRVAYKNAPASVYELPMDLNHNVLTFDIQPKEGIGLQLLAKQPGYGHDIVPVNMHFSYSENFPAPSIDAYARLLLDALDGDQTLFTRSDEVAAEWTFVDSIISRVQEHMLQPQIYEDGSDGPAGLKSLLASV
ncbi:MAG: glucose-6-phosphate dehydrogenase [Candidatus Saccharimonadia bacterium]